MKINNEVINENIPQMNVNCLIEELTHAYCGIIKRLNIKPCKWQ